MFCVRLILPNGQHFGQPFLIVAYISMGAIAVKANREIAVVAEHAITRRIPFLFKISVEMSRTAEPQQFSLFNSTAIYMIYHKKLKNSFATAGA